MKAPIALSFRLRKNFSIFFALCRKIAKYRLLFFSWRLHNFYFTLKHRRFANKLSLSLSKLTHKNYLFTHQFKISQYLLKSNLVGLQIRLCNHIMRNRFAAAITPVNFCTFIKMTANGSRLLYIPCNVFERAVKMS